MNIIMNIETMNRLVMKWNRIYHYSDFSGIKIERKHHWWHNNLLLTWTLLKKMTKKQFVRGAGKPQDFLFVERKSATLIHSTCIPAVIFFGIYSAPTAAEIISHSFSRSFRPKQLIECPLTLILFNEQMYICGKIWLYVDIVKNTSAHAHIQTCTSCSLQRGD